VIRSFLGGFSKGSKDGQLSPTFCAKKNKNPRYGTLQMRLISILSITFTFQAYASGTLKITREQLFNDPWDLAVIHQAMKRHRSTFLHHSNH
jgi:hypothetical protein